MNSIRAIVLILLFNLLGNVGSSQTDTHYWTHQYGAKGLLLNGAVIASPKDESSIFYNPGAIGQDDELGFSFSFLTPTFSTLRTNNFLGEETKLIDHGFGLSPGFLAVRFHLFDSHKLTAGVASFTRNRSSLNYDERLVGASDIGQELFRGDFKFHRNLTEHWFGFGLSYNISDHLGFGLSQFSVWHDETLELRYIKEIFDRDRTDLVELGIRNELGYNFTVNSSFLTKLGLAYQSSKVKLGLTFTSPSYGKLRSGASYTFDEQIILNPDSIMVSSNRRNIKVENYKSPWSIGFGAEFVMNKTHLSFSTEYFRRIDPYFVFNDSDDPFDGVGDRPEEQIFGIAFGNQSVLNFALGFQRKVDEKKTWLWGFRTDFNQRNSFRIVDNLEYLATTPDVFHVSGGGTFKYGKNVISMGVDLGYGYRFGGAALTDLTEINRDNIFITGQPNNVENRFQSIMLFLTYDFIFSHMKSLN